MANRNLFKFQFKVSMSSCSTHIYDIFVISIFSCIFANTEHILEIWTKYTFARYTRRHQLWVNLTQKIFRVERAIASCDYLATFLYNHARAHFLPMWITALGFGHRRVVTPRTASHDYDWLLSQYQWCTHPISSKLIATYLTQQLLFLKKSVVESEHHRRLKLQ